MSLDTLATAASKSRAKDIGLNFGSSLAELKKIFEDPTIPDAVKERLFGQLAAITDNLSISAFGRDASGIGTAFSAPSAAPVAALGTGTSGPTLSDAEMTALEAVANSYSTTVSNLVANLPAYIQEAERKQADLETERDEATRKLAEELDPMFVGSMAQQLEEAKSIADAAITERDDAKTQLAQANAIIGKVFAAFGFDPTVIDDGDKLVAALRAATPTTADPAMAAKATLLDSILAKLAVPVTTSMTDDQLVAAIRAKVGTGGGFNPSATELDPARAAVKAIANGAGGGALGRSWKISKPSEAQLKAAQKAVGLPETGFA